MLYNVALIWEDMNSVAFKSEWYGGNLDTMSCRPSYVIQTIFIYRFHFSASLLMVIKWTCFTLNILCYKKYYDFSSILAVQL